MRTLLLAAIVLAGCTSPPPPPEWCDGTTRGVYDPQHGGAIEVLPDDFWTLPDPDTETGLRIHLEVDQTPGLADYPPEYVSIFESCMPETRELRAHNSVQYPGWGVTELQLH